MATKGSITNAPFLILGYFLFKHLFVSMFLLWHSNDHVENVECIQDNFEVLIC